MSYEMLQEKITQSIESGEPFLIKSFFNYDLDWEDIVSLINNAYHTLFEEDLNKPHGFVFNEKENKYTKLLIPSGVGGAFHTQEIEKYKTFQNSKKYDEIKKVKDIILSMNLRCSIKFSINMLKNGPDVSSHRDTHHVLVTQAIGNAYYTTFDSVESDPFSSYVEARGRKHTNYELNKNDLLFLPYGTIHAVKNLDTRASCIIDIMN